METPALDKAAAGKQVSQKKLVEEANALLKRAESSARSKQNSTSKYRAMGRVALQKGVTTLFLSSSSFAAGRFHTSKAARPAIRIGVGLLADLGGMGAQLSGVKNADMIHAAGDGIFYSGLASASEKYGQELAAKAASSTTPATTNTPGPAGVRPGQPRLPGASSNDEDFVLSPKSRKRREVVRLERD